MWTDLRHRLRAIFRSSAVDGELDDEVAFHLEQYVRSLEQQGASHREAIRRARMEFGTRDEVKEEHREARGISLLPDVARDLQCAFRSLRRTPGATAVAVLSLALSIGATAAVYGTVDWLLNRAPGGVVDPERVVILNTTDREQPGRIGYYFSYQQYLDLIRVQDVFDEVATYAKAIGVAATDGASEQVVFEWVSGNYFAVLGVPPAQGRTFVPEDDWEGVPVVAMISEEFWRTRLLSDPNVLDATLRLNGHPARIIGIVPESFEGFNLDWNGPTDIWVPMQAIKPMGGTLLTTSLASPFIPVFGRLPANMNMNEAMQRAQAWLPQLREHTAVTNYRPTGIVGTPATEMRIARRQQARSFLYVLLMVCALLLLAACFNVANFLVGRAASRRGEIALRAALGASRQRLFRQLLTEATLLGGLGALLGVAAAIVTAQLLADLPRIYLSLPNTRLSTAGSIDYRMAAVAGVLGFVCVLLFGLLPSLMATVRNPIADLKESRAGWSWSRMRITTRHALLVLQIALGVALSVTAGLYAQSFLRASNVALGYDRPDAVLLARVLGVGPSDEDERAFYEALLLKLNDSPGVLVGSVGWNLPFAIGSTPVSLPGQEDASFRAGWSAGAPGYFKSYGVGLVAGREFRNDEDAKTGLVINRVLAEQLWPQGDPVGQTVLFGNGREPRTVVGVVADRFCHGPLDGEVPCAWTPYPRNGATAIIRVRTQGPPLEFVPELRQIVRDLDPKAAISEVHAFDEYLKEATAGQRVASVICAVLALLGVSLLAFGCASLYVSLVRDSAREIAIRMALGADAARLFRRMLAHGLCLGVLGGLLGLVGGWLVARQIADQLYETSTTEPAVLMGAPGLVAVIVLVALAVPAAAAVRRNPLQHLRRE